MATTSSKSERVEIITSMQRRKRWSPVLGNTLPKIMILVPMCSLNDFGPGSTLEAEPIIGLINYDFEKNIQNFSD